MKMQKSDYIFGKRLGGLMGKISPQTQLESSMLGSIFILVGVCYMAVMNVFFTDASPMAHAFAILLWLGFIFFIGSGIITSFQQYKTYMAAIEIQRQMQEERALEDSQKETATTKLEDEIKT